MAPNLSAFAFLGFPLCIENQNSICFLLFNFILSVLPPQIATGPYCYLIFCAICLGVAVYTIFVLPETKNKTFMEISQMFAAKNNILKEELIPNGHLKLDMMNGYGTLGHRDEK